MSLMDRLTATFTPEEIAELADLFNRQAQRSQLTPEKLAALRAPFRPEQISYKPSVYCRDCREAPGKVCKNHRKIKCGGCGQTITSAHMHLSYVGHADVTDRLLSVDPHWSWEPQSYDANGLPQFDEHGGLWGKLTVLGKTVLGYGAPSPGKRGPDAIKETIGDLIRNCSMRDGVALELWNGKFGDVDSPAEVDSLPAEMEPLSAAATLVQLKRIKKLWNTLGFVGDANLTNRLRLSSHTIHRDMADENDLTCEEAVVLIEALEDRVKASEKAAAKAAKTSAKTESSE